MKERLSIASTLLLLICYACAEPETATLPSPAAAAGSAVVLTARLDFLVDNPADPEALASMTRIYTELTSVANARQGGAAPFAGSLTHKVPLDACIVRENSLITYDDCNVSNGTIDGTIATRGDEIAFDLRIAAEGVGGVGSLAVLMQGGITLTRTALAGSLTYDTIILGLEDYPDGFAFAMEADYRGIVLDESQCPLSGSLHVAQELPDEATPPVEALFGPLCSDVRFFE